MEFYIIIATILSCEIFFLLSVNATLLKYKRAISKIFILVKSRIFSDVYKENKIKKLSIVFLTLNFKFLIFIIIFLLPFTIVAVVVSEFNEVNMLMMSIFLDIKNIIIIFFTSLIYLIIRNTVKK